MKILAKALIFSLVTSTICLSQDIDFKNYKGVNVVIPNISNMLKMVDMPTPVWEEQVKNAGYPTRQLKNGAIEFMYMSSLSNPYGMLSISKGPRQITIAAMHSKIPSSTYLDDLYNELEKYYVREENNSQVYGFKKDGFNYKFNISRNDNIEIVVLTKQY
ncbi:hypothetical protein [Larkinella sp.]|uniref:hypothetical protein n=1 Tax=Larkinella sp. TaxID=2034517 RepID=UPI003BAB87B4